jgi:hypothetical protein
MTEVTVINLAFILRVFVVGSILVLLPRITRKGLLFGAYIGEEAYEQQEARQLLTRWALACGGVMLFSLAVGLGISVAGWPLPGNLTGTAVLLAAGGVLYLWFHFRSRRLIPSSVVEQAKRSIAPLDVCEPQGVGLSRFTFGFCVILSLATFIYAWVKQEAVTDRSYLYVMWGPCTNLLLSPFLALYSLLITTAKRSFRGGSGGGSLEAQQAFRAAMTGIYTWSALLFCAFMSFLSVQLVRFSLGEIGNPGIGILLGAAPVLLFFVVSLIRIFRRFGQGGALLEDGSAEAPLTNGLADNTHWIAGIFYVDRDDPSIMVENRFGVGYTFNYGNRAAILIMVAFFALLLALVALVVLKS